MSPDAPLAVSPVWPRLQIPERPASPRGFSLIGAATTPTAHATSLSWLSMWAGESRGAFGARLRGGGESDAAAVFEMWEGVQAAEEYVGTLEVVCGGGKDRV